MIDRWYQIEQLVQRINPESKLRRVQPLEGGISAEMAVFEIEQPDGQLQKMVLRLLNQMVFEGNADAAEHEFKLLQMLYRVGLFVPMPYYVGQAGEIFATPYLVLEYVEGEMTFSPPDVANYVRQLAAHLAAIHRLGQDKRLAFSFLPQSGYHCDELGRETITKFDELLDAERIRDVLSSVAPLVQKNRSTLLHGDFWPGNILWQNDSVVAVVDWEDAKIGDPLIDLAMIRSEIVWIFGGEALQTFTSYYQSEMALDYGQLPYWDLCATLRFIRFANDDLDKMAAFFEAFGRSDITAVTIRKHYAAFIRQAFDKIG